VGDTFSAYLDRSRKPECGIRPIRVKLRWKSNSERKRKRRTGRSVIGTLLEYDKRCGLCRILVMQLERLGNSARYV